MVVGLVFASFAWAQQAATSRERVITLFQQAQTSEQAQDYANAADSYRSILKLDPGIAEVWSNLGIDLYRLQKDKEAIAAFDKAIALKPSLLAPQLFEGKAYLESGRPEKALEPLKRAYALAPGETQTLLALGDAFAKLHQFAPSIRVLRDAAKQDPDSEDVGSHLAVTYIEWATSIGIALKKSSGVYGKLLTDEDIATEHPDLAEGEFRKTIKSAPGIVEVRLALVRFLISNKPTAQSLQTARREMEAATQQAPRNPAVMGAAVRLAIAEGDFPQALAKLKSLSELDPAFTLASLDILTAGLPSSEAQEVSAQVHVAKEEPAASDSYSSQLSALDRIRSHRSLTAHEAAEYASAAWHLRSYQTALLQLSGRPTLTDEEKYWLFRTCMELGERELERTVSAHPDSLRSHLLLADLALQQNDLGAARSEYQAALKLGADNPDVWLLYVRFLETARDPGQALQEAKRGATQFPDSAGLNFEAGDLILLSQGDPADAAHYLERSIQADPRPTRPHVDLAEAYARLGRFNDAIKEMNLVSAADIDGTMHYQLAGWYRQTGHPELAAKALAECERIQQAKLVREKNFVSKLDQKDSR